MVSTPAPGSQVSTKTVGTPADLRRSSRPGSFALTNAPQTRAALSLSRIASEGRILEIGCGPGNATLSFAARGYTILGIELGERLAALAAKNCRAYPGVTILNLAFEDWPLDEGAFDLALAADAFHWIPPEIGYPKVARALKASGSAAFFWSVPVDPETDWSRTIDRVYHDTAPEFINPDKRFEAD